MRFKRLLTTAFLVAASSIAARADTYTFVQTGFVLVDKTPWDILVQGSFTGTPEADGYIQQADLSSFSATVSRGGSSHEFSEVDLELFSFLPEASGTLDLFASALDHGDQFELCSGAAAAFGACGTAGAIAGEFSAPGLGFYTTTTNAAIVALVPPQPAPVPEPASLALMSIGLISAAASTSRRLFGFVRGR